MVTEQQDLMRIPKELVELIPALNLSSRSHHWEKVFRPAASIARERSPWPFISQAKLPEGQLVRHARG